MGKYKNTLAALLVIIALSALGWWWQENRQVPAPVQPSSLDLPAGEGEEMLQPANQARTGNAMEGTLKASDNSRRGNLMLVSATATVYIFTSRDYGHLLDREVKVFYDGTAEDFRLGDIIAK